MGHFLSSTCGQCCSFKINHFCTIFSREIEKIDMKNFSFRVESLASEENEAQVFPVGASKICWLDPNYPTSNGWSDPIYPTHIFERIGGC